MWSYAVTMCEVVGGFNPFYDQDILVMYENILSSNIKWPKNMPNLMRNLISKILVIDTNIRFTINDIKKHTYFSVNFITHS